jgi:predicted amidohydrolase
VVHFHEAALTGYLTHADAPPTQQVDWRAVRAGAESICQEAARLGVWVVLGSSHPLTAPHKPTNCLYLIGPDGMIRDRYDKRFCTEGDLRVYTPGGRHVIFELRGWRCALLICFDLRFPELYRDLYRQGVRVVFQSFHNARYKGPGIHGQIMRQTLQANAAHNAMWISAPNSSARFSRWPSVFIGPDGVIAGQLRPNRPGLMVNTVDPDLEYYDPMKPFRADVLAGQLHTGQLVEDPRLDDHTSL